MEYEENVVDSNRGLFIDISTHFFSNFNFLIVFFFFVHLLKQIWLEEMSVKEMFQPGVEEEDESVEDDEEAKKNEISISKKELKRRLERMKFGRSVESKVKRQKKQLLEKIKQRKMDNEKKIRIQQNEIFRLRSIKKEVEEKLKQEEEDKLKRDAEKKHKDMFEAKRLGAVKYEEPDLELKLSNEITGNLRTLKVFYTYVYICCLHKSRSFLLMLEI